MYNAVLEDIKLKNKIIKEIETTICSTVSKQGSTQNQGYLLSSKRGTFCIQRVQIDSVYAETTLPFFLSSNIANPDQKH